mmetsp:Transcript_147223/g.367139  ORF Transcript_147223/g.367139 Transcript_147223/m.367139 type:complete len:205 (-) Transcript_147223:478-1092(-)
MWEARNAFRRPSSQVSPPKPILHIDLALDQAVRVLANEADVAVLPEATSRIKTHCCGQRRQANHLQRLRSASLLWTNFLHRPLRELDEVLHEVAAQATTPVCQGDRNFVDVEGGLVRPDCVARVAHDLVTEEHGGNLFASPGPHGVLLESLLGDPADLRSEVRHLRGGHALHEGWHDSCPLRSSEYPNVIKLRSQTLRHPPIFV